MSLMLSTSTISRSMGSFVEVAWKNGIVIFDKKVPSGFVRLMISRLPLTRTPLTWVASPSLTSFALTMFVALGSVMNCAPGELRSWFATRSIAYAKFRAVTGVPSLKRKPLRTSERVALAPVRDLVPGRDLGAKKTSCGSALVRVVVELCRGGVLEPPGGRDVGELRVDLDGCAGRPTLQTPPLRSGAALASCATTISAPPRASIVSESQSRRIYLSASEGMLQSW